MNLRGLLKPCNCSALIKAIDNYIAKVDNDLESGLKKTGYVKPKKTVQQMNDLEDELAELLEEDTKFILNTINDFDDLKDFLNEAWPELQDNGKLVEKLTRTFSSTFEEIVPEYAAEYLKRVESDIALERVSLTHQTTNWIQSWSEELSRIMKLNDNSTIQKILDRGLRKGSSIQDVAEKISDSGIRDPGYKARRVAVTEVLRAHSVAQQESFMQSPAVDDKMWRHSGIRNRTEPRQNHMDMDGQTVKKDQPYTLVGADGGIYYPMYPKDSNLPASESINCGCISQPIVNEEVLGLSLEERNRLRDEAIAELDEEFDRQLDEQNKKLAMGLRDTDEWRNEITTGSPIDNSYENGKIKNIEVPDIPDEISSIKGMSKDIHEQIVTSFDNLSKEYELRIDSIAVESLGSRNSKVPFQYVPVNAGVYKSKIVINSDFDFNGDLDTFNKRILKNHDNGFLAAKNLDDLIAHEAAHVMTFQDAGTYGAFLRMEEEVREQFVKGISNYADSTWDGAESISEAFVRRRNGESISEKAGSLLKTYIDRWRK